MERTSALSGSSLKVLGAHAQVLNYSKDCIVLCSSNQSSLRNNRQRPRLLVARVARQESVRSTAWDAGHGSPLKMPRNICSGNNSPLLHYTNVFPNLDQSDRASPMFRNNQFSSQNKLNKDIFFFFFFHL